MNIYWKAKTFNFTNASNILGFEPICIDTGTRSSRTVLATLQLDSTALESGQSGPEMTNARNCYAHNSIKVASTKSFESLVNCVNHWPVILQQLLTISGSSVAASDNSSANLTSTTGMDQVKYCRGLSIPSPRDIILPTHQKIGDVQTREQPQFWQPARQTYEPWIELTLTNETARTTSVLQLHFQLF